MFMWRATEIVFACHRFAIPGLGNVMVSQGKENQFQVVEKDFSLLHSIWTGSGAHPASCPIDIRGCFLRDEVDGA
jgi:hypothetical protein